MIRIVRPAAAPAVLDTRGATAAKTHCDDYDASPKDYRTGAKAFDFNPTIYAAEGVKDALRTAQHGK